MPQPPEQTTVVVVTWRGRDHIDACLDALAGQDRPHRLLVVDNASDDGTAERLAAHPSRPRVLRLPRNTGYAGGIAAASAVVDTPLIAWLNDDAVPDPAWLATLEDALRPDVAAVGSRLERQDGTVQSLGVRLTPDGHGEDRVTESTGEPFAFCGGAAVVRTDALRDAGGVPAAFFCYYEDTDTSWRLRLNGWRVTTATDARVVHHHGASTEPGSAAFHRWNERNRLLMLLRCAPASVAARELARFAAITAALPTRRARPSAANFRVGLRLRVLGAVATRLPATLVARRTIGARATIPRKHLWRTWSTAPDRGSPAPDPAVQRTAGTSGSGNQPGHSDDSTPPHDR